MRRELPVLLTSIVGLILIVEHFFQVPEAMRTLVGHMQNWGVIIAAFALALAAVNLVRIHGVRISQGHPAWIQSVILLIGLFGTIFFGVVLGRDSTAFKFVFQALFSPLGAAFYAMTAFNLASASYRAFRAKNAQATVVLVAGVLLMLGRAPIGEVIWSRFPAIATWIMSVGNLAGSRGIMISIAVGVIGVGMRVLTGIDRSHLGVE